MGLGDRIAEKPRSPGRSYAPILRGEEVEWTDEMGYEMEGCRSFRTEEWKIVLRRMPDGPTELYDMKNDPMERFNLSGEPKFAAIEKEMTAKLEAFFNEYAEPKYDIWKGGESKSRRFVPNDADGFKTGATWEK